MKINDILMWAPVYIFWVKITLNVSKIIKIKMKMKYEQILRNDE